MTHRSSDARPGDYVMIHVENSPFYGHRAIVRHTYRDNNEELVASLVVHPNEASEFMKANVPEHPDGGFHYMAKASEFDIIQRRTYH